MHQSVAVEGAAAAGDVKAEWKPLLRRHASQLLLGFAGLLHGHAVLLRQALGTIARALRRRAGVELEAPPRHVDLVAVLEALERSLETALADVAPRARDVRPDLDVHSRLLLR